ncbi:5'-nucleotidase C-terminal domain-containing protein [Mycoplasmopsis edwardii]|uniref:5'-nucleotidase C-terminal domain-containing protein n=1 Tax=Mycoplasmopsis edwardii TaxID=53558 RepID=A0ACD4PH98_9BACT|nr:5'-nucleotidase C-terminal domain-containing protein [Mycoplasmopsis edwardii]WBP83983.1 5'-nucleotidase C-terminal domain-containing protein [Mycoplasmopsis edwardii]
MKNKKFLSKFLLGFSVSTLAIPMVAISCAKQEDKTNEKQQLAESLRKEYRENNALYNQKLDEFSKKLKTLKDKLGKEKTETKKTEIENEIFDLFFEANQTLNPLVQKYNLLFTQLREAEKAANSKLRTVKIYHSNDEHGRLEFDDYKYNRYAGMIETSKYLKDKKRDLLLSAGDLIQGLPLSDSDKGKTITDIAHYMGYDSVAIGNHEFDYGLEHVLSLNKTSSTEKFGVKTPFISANIYYKDLSSLTEKPTGYDQSKVGKRVFEPYIIKELESGLKVAIFAITTPDTVYTSHPRNSALVEFRDPVESSNEVLKEIKQKHPDISFVIATTHLGTGRNDAKWTSEYLAQNVEGELDLILDGHSHTYVEINKKHAEAKNIYITQTEAYTKYLGDIDVTFDTETGKIHEVHQVLRNVDQIEVYNANLSERLVKRLKKAFDKENSVVAFTSPGVFEHTTTKEVDRVPYWVGRILPTSLGVFAADSIAWGFMKERPWQSHDGWEEATLDNSIGLVNGGGLRANFAEGEITKGAALSVSPFGNRIATVRVKGTVLTEVLKHGLSRGRSGAFSQLSSNVAYEVNAVRKTNEKTGKEEYVWTPTVESFKINDKAINPEKYYYITTNDFILAGGDGYKMINTNEVKTIDLAYEGDKYIDTLIDFAKLTTDSSSTLESSRFERSMSSYLDKQTYSKQVVNIPNEAYTNTLTEPNNKP